jgi:hypothetical protein
MNRLERTTARPVAEVVICARGAVPSNPPNQEINMKRLLAVLIGSMFCAMAAAQSPAPATDAAAAKAEANKSKQEMVKQATEGTMKPSGAPPSKAHAPAQAKKLTKQQKKDAMAGVSKSAGSQYGPNAAAQAAKIDPNAPKVAKPDMSDPKVKEAMEKQKR